MDDYVNEWVKSFLTILLGLPPIEVDNSSHWLASHHLHSFFKVHILSQEGKQNFLESSCVSCVSLQPASWDRLEGENWNRRQVFFLAMTPRTVYKSSTAFWHHISKLCPSTSLTWACFDKRKLSCTKGPKQYSAAKIGTEHVWRDLCESKALAK